MSKESDMTERLNSNNKSKCRVSDIIVLQLLVQWMSLSSSLIALTSKHTSLICRKISCCVNLDWKVENKPLPKRTSWICKELMVPHSSTLAWKIPWMEESGRLQSMGLLRDGHDWATSLSLFTFMHWRRKWQPTPVFLPGESQGRGNLVGCRLWGHSESNTTEVT